MVSIAHIVRNALEQHDHWNMVYNGGPQSHQLERQPNLQQINRDDGADSSNRNETRHSRAIRNGGVSSSHQMAEQSQRRQMLLNNGAGPSNRDETPPLQSLRNGVLSASSQSVIHPVDSQLYRRASNRQVIQSIDLSNEAGPSNQRNDDVISISSGASTTNMDDSGASTAPHDLAALHGNQQMESENLNDSGISIDSNEDINRMSEFIEFDYIIHQLTPLHPQFLMPLHPSTSQRSLPIPHTSMRVPTPHPIPNQNRMQYPAPLQNPAAQFEQLVDLVEQNDQPPPPPLPPRRSQNLRSNPSNGEYFRCVICMEPVIGNDPHTTPCGHTICHADLDEWLNHHQA